MVVAIYVGKASQDQSIHSHYKSLNSTLVHACSASIHTLDQKSVTFHFKSHNAALILKHASDLGQHVMPL